MAAKADATDNTNKTAAADAPHELANKSILTAPEAKTLDAFKNDPKAQVAALHNEVKVGAADSVHKETGTVKDIANSDAVRKSVEACKSSDPSCKVSKDGEISFAAMSAGDSLLSLAKGKPGDATAAAGADNTVAMAGSLPLGDARFAPQDKVGEVKPQGSDATGKPGDNSVREINTATDNPKAVTQRYDQMVDKLGLPPSEAASMKKQFDANMDQIQKNYTGDDVSRITRSMNLMMDNNNYLQNDGNRVNAVAGLAARGANPEEANRQGANPTCALTSESRIEQEHDFAKYADQMGSVAAKGGAWRGGADGAKVWVDVNAKGTNGANFMADAESSHMYSTDFHQAQGHRDYLGQLDNAVVGGEMAKYASAKNGQDLVYVAANSQRVAGADMSQSAGGALMERAGSGLQAVRDGSGNPMESPPSTLDMVAKVNHANGGQGTFIQENLAAQFRKPDGSYPEGMKVFHDSADLKAQLAHDGKTGQEFQIITNGTLVAGKQGHALHVQEISLNQAGNLELGNNWDNKSNHVEIKPADFAQLDRFTNPNKWDTPPPRTPSYPNGWEGPSGPSGPNGLSAPWHEGSNGPMPKDWTKVIVGPGSDNTIARDSFTDPLKKHDDDKNDADKPEKKDKSGKDSPEQQQLKQTLHTRYLEQFNAAKAAFDSNPENAGKEFHFSGIDESLGL